MNKFLYKIKNFAELLGITPDTLIFYEKKGLFLPFKKNPQSGYRYYSTYQVSEISLIIQLKELGFTLEEIKVFKSASLGLDDKIDVLKKKINGLNKLLNLYEFYEKAPGFSPYVKQAPEHYAVSRKCTVLKSEDIEKEFENLIYNINKNRLRIKHPINVYCRFNDDEFKFNDNDVEIFTEVERAPHPKVIFEPNRRYLCTVFKGDYQNMKSAYDFLYSYAEAKNITITGRPVEHYLEAYGTENLSENYITEICLPID